MSEGFLPEIVADLELPETRLRVVDGELQRLSESGAISMRLQLETVKRIEFQKRFDKAFLVIVTVAIGFGLIGALVSTNNIVTCICYALAMITFLFGIGGCFDKVIVIVTDDELLDVINRDAPDVLDGFISSLRKMIADMHRL